VLYRTWGVRPGDRVLDIGCGSGQTTREAARIARAGSAFGVDIAASAIERARELARAQGVRNVAFSCADAQVCRFPRGQFDVAVSRFGTMFFDDPVAAFSNIGQALRRDGRLAMMVWQDRERNEWEVAIRQALGPVAAASDPFSLGDPPAVTGMLEAAGFGGVAFADVQERMYFGSDVAAALDWIGGFASTRAALGRLEPDAAARALARLRETVAEHMTGDGVWFGSRAWIVTAQRGR
jgi:SAM-dependent methyltransferase